MSIDFDFTSYIHLVDFLGACLGEGTEVVLQSFEDIDHAVIAMYNGHITGQTIGSPISGFAMAKLKDKGKDSPPYYSNYLGKSKNNTPLRSNSFFILDKQGNPRGMLCIHTDVSKYQQAADLLQKLAYLPMLEGEAKESGVMDAYHTSPREMIQAIIHEVTHTTGLESQRFTVEEKIEIVRRLNGDKFFLIKGAVSQVSGMIGTSEATIYRYLSNINKNIRNGAQQ